MASTNPLSIWRGFARLLPELVVAVFLALFASGAARALTSDHQASATTAQKSLRAIQAEESMLIVGSEQDFPPFATGMTDDTAGGFTVDLWKAVATEAGLRYTIRVRPFRQVLQEFREGRIDVLINLAYSDERRQFADLTVPHVVVNGAIFVRKGESDIRSEDDLAGKSIIVLNADLAHDYAVSKGWEKQLVLVDTSADGFRLLASGKHDAMLLSHLAGMQTLKAAGLTNIVALKAKAGFSQRFAFAVHKGQSELLATLNEGMALAKSDGTYNALYEKWFGIYETKEVGLRDLLQYIIPIVLVFIGIGAYFFYRRRVERRDWETRLHTLYTAIEQSPASVVITDLEARIQYVNPRFTDVTGYSAAEVIGQNSRILKSGQTPKEIYLELWGKLTSGLAWKGELLNKRKNGELYWEESHIAPVKSSTGAVSHYVAVKTDITERRQTDQALRASLSEKEVMMREIHHRVKNNLQMMSSLLELQSGYVKDEQARGYFRESQQRIQSMAMIHAQLFRKDNLAQIDFATYLRSLVDNLRGQFGERCKRVNIRVNAMASTLPVDIAVPLGLVINELVTNAMEHAFPGNRAGELRIGLQSGGAGNVVLEVADNGVGLPAESDLQGGKGFGMRLVRLMVEDQLHGKLRIETIDGTRVVCEIGGQK